MRRGIFTTEFWATIGVTALTHFADFVPAPWKAGLTTASVVAYVLSRGLAKMGAKKALDAEPPSTPPSTLQPPF